MNKLDIEVGKRRFTCSFGLGFLGECLENLDLSITDIGDKLDKNPFRWIPILMYESIKYPKDELDFSKGDLIEWLDNDGDKGTKTMNSFVVAFLNSLTKNVPKEETEQVKGEQDKGKAKKK
jgi:hypothetical protein